jgi:hypothetical protein
LKAGRNRGRWGTSSRRIDGERLGLTGRCQAQSGQVLAHSPRKRTASRGYQADANAGDLEIAIRVDAAAQQHCLAPQFVQGPC